MTLTRQVSVLGAAIITTLLLPGAAQAEGILFLPSVQFGTPLKTSAGLGIFIATKVEGGDRTAGLIVEGSAGQGGVRGSFGRASYIEYMGLDLRGVFQRTGSSPRGASARASYVGAEAGLTIAYVRLSIGVGQRVAGPDGEHRTILTWTAGIQIPIKH